MFLFLFLFPFNLILQHLIELINFSLIKMKQRQKNKLSHFRNSCLGTLGQFNKHSIESTFNISNNTNHYQHNYEQILQKQFEARNTEQDRQQSQYMEENQDLDQQFLEKASLNSQHLKKRLTKSRFKPTHHTCITQQHRASARQQKLSNFNNNEQNRNNKQNKWLESEQSSQFGQNQSQSQVKNYKFNKFEKQMLILRLLNKTQQKIVQGKQNFYLKDLQFLKQGNRLMQKIKKQEQLTFNQRDRAVQKDQDSQIDNYKDITDINGQAQIRKRGSKPSIIISQNDNFVVFNDSDSNLISSWNALQNLDITYKTKEEQLIRQNYQLTTKIKDLQTKLKQLNNSQHLSKHQGGKNYQNFSQNYQQPIQKTLQEQKQKLCKFGLVLKRIDKLHSEKAQLKLILAKVLNQNEQIEKTKNQGLKNINQKIGKQTKTSQFHNQSINKHKKQKELIKEPRLRWKDISQLIEAKFGKEVMGHIENQYYTKMVPINQATNDYSS